MHYFCWMSFASFPVNSSTKYILFKKVKDWNLENEVRMNLRSGSEEFDMKTISLFRIQNPNLIRIDPPLSSLSGWMDVVMCIMSRVPEECVIYCEEDSPDYRPLIGHNWSRDLNTGFLLVKVVSLADRVQRWTDDPDFSPLPHIKLRFSCFLSLLTTYRWCGKFIIIAATARIIKTTK